MTSPIRNKPDASGRDGSRRDSVAGPPGTGRLLFELVETLPVGVFALEADGTPCYANRRAIEILGQDARRDVPTGRLAHAYHVREASTGKLYPTHRMPIVRALAGERSYEDDFVIIREGRQIPCAVWASPLTDSRGKILYAVAVFVDITEQRRAEEVARRAERLASIGTLAAGIAHEINNPLQSILSAAEYALRQGEARGTRSLMEEALRDIVDNAKRGGRIVRSILQFARQTRSETWLHDLNEVVRRCLDLIRQDPNWRDLDLDAQLAPQPLICDINAVQMEHVLVNVLRNALALDPPCSCLTVRTECAAEVARITVEDDGPGMSLEEQQHAFDPFFTSRRSKGGTGLGLSLSHAIVSQHRGTMSIQSTPGLGTRVTIDLPIVEAAREENGA